MILKSLLSTIRQLLPFSYDRYWLDDVTISYIPSIYYNISFYYDRYRVDDVRDLVHLEYLLQHVGGLQCVLHGGQLCV